MKINWNTFWWQTQSIMHIFVCAWACGCIRTHQQLRQISVVWWPKAHRQNKLVPFLSLFCSFSPMPNYYVADGLFSILLQFLFCHSFSTFWPDLSLLTNEALKAYLSLFSFCLGWGWWGVMALLRQKNQTHCSISLLLAPSFCLLKFWCWMVTHCEIASCLGGLCGARSGSYIWPSLDSDF